MLQLRCQELCAPSTSGRDHVHATAGTTTSSSRASRHRAARQARRPLLPQSSAGGSCTDGKRRKSSAVQSAAQAIAAEQLEEQVLAALENVIDPDFGASIVACGFVKDLAIDHSCGRVAFRLELTTPACPVKDEFQRQCKAFVGALDWVETVEVTIDAQAPRAVAPDDNRAQGLQGVAHIIAVSSCKGGVGKSTTAVNLAYTLAQMGASVGIFDADVYGPSLPTMVSPKNAVLAMDPATKHITPTEYEGVKLVSFGFAGQGSAIMRGAMVSGLIQQLLTTTQWGDLDYLVVDFPPGTGDIQLTLCQTVAFSAAVIVTTPQKLAFIDVAKGIRMFARLEVPCVAVVENMSFFEVDGVRHFPFGRGSGDRIVADFGLQNLVRFPIIPDLSAAGDGGKPLVVAAPSSPTAQAFMDLGAAVVREVAKLKAAPKASLRYDSERQALILARPSGRESALHPAFVRRNDTSAASINEWTGEKVAAGGLVPDGIAPSAIQAVGNYAVLIMWEDGFNQIAPFDHLETLVERQEEQAPALESRPKAAANGVAQIDNPANVGDAQVEAASAAGQR